MVNLVDIGAYMVDDIAKAVPLVSISFVGIVVIIVALSIICRIFGRRFRL